MSSILVNIPQTQVAYNASNAAVVHLTKILVIEWTEFARMDCISSGFMMTKSKYFFLRPRKEEMLNRSQLRIPVLTQQPKELFDKWLGMISGGQICDPVELTGVSPVRYPGLKMSHTNISF